VMINSVNSGMSMPPPPPKQEQNLTEEQQTLISETLSQFDADNLSQADAMSIVETISQAGIQPGSGMEAIMAELGFDAKTIGDLAGVSEQGRMPPPPKQSSDEISSMVDYLTELMEEKFAESNSTSLSNDDKEQILSQVFEKFGIDDGESIINTTA